jgi:lysyl-tRNA synthetase class 2
MQEMIQTIVERLFGKLEITVEGRVVDISGDWPTITMRDLILKYAPIDIKVYDTKEKLYAKIKEEKLDIDSETPLEDLGYGNLVDQLYKKVARPHVVEPVFLTEHPISLSPLARANDEDKTLTDRFQLIINGAEIINAYSELVDPIEQESRLKEQASLKDAGDEEAMMMDYDYIGAMEYGMPPISGWGMGIDRLIQILTGADNIRDCVLFPLMKPEDK